MPGRLPPWTDLRLMFVTPAFVGQPPAAGTLPFPVSSLRGALRYWLRALVGAHVGDDLSALARAETAVFGAAAGDDGGISSRIILRAPSRVGYQPATANAWLPDGQRGLHLRYLLGQGLTNGKQLSRPYLPAGTDLPLRVRILGGPAHRTLFFAALWALTTFGGVGARARRGFGTMALADGDLPSDAPAWLTDPAALPAVLTEVGHALAELGVTPTTAMGDDRPSYPRFDVGEPKWYRVGTWQLDHAHVDASAALAMLGDQLRRFRLHHEHSHEPQPSHGPEYAAIVRPFLAEGRASTQPATIAALGLPITYSEPSTGGRGRRSAIIEPMLPAEQAPAPAAVPGPPKPGPNPRLLAKRKGSTPSAAQAPIRRASPLWLRVYRDSHGWHLRSLAFYSDFLPDPATLRIRDTTASGARSSEGVVLPGDDAIDDLLDNWFD